MSDLARRLERVQQLRSRPDRATSIADLVAQAAQQASRTHRRLGRFIDLWESALPLELVSRTRVTNLRGGTVHVTAESSAIAFELDRLLRAGLEHELRRRFTGTLVRVKVTVGQVEDA